MRRAWIFGAACLPSSLSAVAAVHRLRALRAWNQEQAPFQIFGNTYYVGVRGLSSVLITSPDGHVLIDGALPQSAPLIAQHVEQLGFKIERRQDHPEFACALRSRRRHRRAAEAQRRESHCERYRGEGPANGQGRSQRSAVRDLKPFPAVKNVEALGARKSVEVGKLQLRVIHTPGHTPGGTSWTWTSCEAERCLNVVYGDSLNAVSDDSFKYCGDERYPNAASDMLSSIAAIAPRRATSSSRRIRISPVCGPSSTSMAKAIARSSSIHPRASATRQRARNDSTSAWSDEALGVAMIRP